MEKAGEGAGVRNIGYLRVSTKAQDNDKFRADLLQFAMDRGFGRVEWVQEQVSGKMPWRERALGEVVNGLREGDRLIVPELSRLGRHMLEILEIIQIAREKGACIYAVKGGWELNGTIQSKIVASVMAMMAEVERDLIIERTNEALNARKAMSEAGESWVSKSGRVCKKLGRPEGPGKSKLDGFKAEIIGLLNNGATQSWIARRYKTSPQNLANWMTKHDIQRPKE